MAQSVFPKSGFPATSQNINYHQSQGSTLQQKECLNLASCLLFNREMAWQGPDSSQTPGHCCFIFVDVIFIVAFSYGMWYWLSFNGRNVGFSFAIVVFSKNGKKKKKVATQKIKWETDQATRYGLRHEAVSQGHLDTSEIKVTMNKWSLGKHME